MSAVEFAIWGKGPGRDYESLLLSHPGGKPITEQAAADLYAKVLERDHGCTELRIQRLDLSEPFDFARAALGAGR